MTFEIVFTGLGDPVALDLDVVDGELLFCNKLLDVSPGPSGLHRLGLPGFGGPLWRYVDELDVGVERVIECSVQQVRFWQTAVRDGVHLLQDPNGVVAV